MRLLKISIAVLAITASATAGAQGVFFDSEPTDVTGAVKLFVDITSDACDCPELQDADPDTNPLYIWTWNPNETRPLLFGETVTNGTWENSNENLRMKRDETNPNLWYFDFLGASPAQFYDVPPAVFYETGISFLLKEKSGAGDPEQKSPDINIIPEPLGCVEVICPFPTTFFQDDYLIITYDNNQESAAALQNMGPDDAHIIFRYRVSGVSGLQNFPSTPATADPAEFKMDYDGDGIFSVTMIPQDYFPIQEGQIITEIRVLVTTLPLNLGPTNSSSPLAVGCPQ